MMDYKELSERIIDIVRNCRDNSVCEVAISILLENKFSIYIDDSNVLEALRAGGVDNWEGYGDSIESMNDDGY